jgi:hypothetical protein
MGEKNTVSGEYLSLPERFAQMFNAAVFQGKDLIQPQYLRELDPTERVILQQKKRKRGSKELQSRETYRDILKIYNEEAILLILGIENQDEIHYAMPLRHMLYDAGNYQKQWRNLKQKHQADHDLGNSSEFLSGFSISDRLLPVITLCIYWGSEPWNGPRNLHEMLDIPQELDQYKSMIGDYPLNLLEVCKLENLEQFSGELKALLGFVRYQKEKDNLLTFINQNRNLFESMSPETTRAISVFGNVHELDRCLQDYNKCRNNETTGGINVCVALQELMRDSELKGRREGKLEGKLEGGIFTLIEDNLEEGIPRERILEKLQRRFQLKPEEAENYFNRVTEQLS